MRWRENGNFPGMKIMWDNHTHWDVSSTCRSKCGLYKTHVSLNACLIFSLSHNPSHIRLPESLEQLKNRFLFCHQISSLSPHVFCHLQPHWDWKDSPSSWSILHMTFLPQGYVSFRIFRTVGREIFIPNWGRNDDKHEFLAHTHLKSDAKWDDDTKKKYFHSICKVS